jgi:putative FmdB family regulatory protein
LIIEYECAMGHVTEKLRKFEHRDTPLTCPKCGGATTRIEISQPHCPPDGIYSFAPNVGDPAKFERHQQALRDGKKIIKGGE